MALASLGYPIEFPKFPMSSAAAPAYQSVILDAADEKAAYVVFAPKTGSIRKVHFRTGTVTTGATVDVRLETVSATDGTPTGTLFGTDTNVSQVIADANDNTWFTTAALTADASVTIGDILAVVIVNPAVSPGNLNIVRTNAPQSAGMPYSGLYTTSWAKSNAAPVVVLEYSDGSMEPIPGVWSFSALSNDTSTSATLHRGCEITPPFKCRVMGCWAIIERVTASGTWTFKLFDSDGTTVLASKAVDSDQFDSNNVSLKWLPFTATATLTAGTKYWLAVVSDGTSGARLYYADYTSTGVLNATAPGKGAVLWSQATSPAAPGDWTATNTRIPWMGLLIDQLDDGAGGSGGVIGGPNMRAGMMA